MRRFREVREIKEADEKLPDWQSTYSEVNSLPEKIEISIDEEIQKEVDSLPEKI